MVEFTFLLTKKRTEPGADLGFSGGAGWMGDWVFRISKNYKYRKLSKGEGAFRKFLGSVPKYGYLKKVQWVCRGLNP